MSIDFYYYSFSPSRADQAWLTFVEDFKVVRHRYRNGWKNIDNTVSLNKRQEFIAKMPLDYLIYHQERDEEMLIQELKIVDVYFGSVQNDYFENPKSEFITVETLIDVLDLENDDGVITKEGWLKLKDSITNENMQKVVNSSAMLRHWSNAKTAGWEIKEYLRAVLPIIHDLSVTKDAVFLYACDGFNSFSPSSADQLLIQRAEQHRVDFHGQLDSVL